MTIRNTVALKKYTDSYIELVANAAITPGHLVEIMNTGKVRKHALASGNALPKMFAVEDELQGKGIDSAYAQGDPVQVAICQPGDVIYALLQDGENVKKGDPLESYGDGTLRKVVADSTGIYYYNQIVGIAWEDLDLTSSSGAEPTMRIPVLIV